MALTSVFVWCSSLAVETAGNTTTDLGSSGFFCPTGRMVVRGDSDNAVLMVNDHSLAIAQNSVAPASVTFSIRCSVFFISTTTDLGSSGFFCPTGRMVVRGDSDNAVLMVNDHLLINYPKFCIPRHPLLPPSAVVFPELPSLNTHKLHFDLCPIEIGKQPELTIEFTHCPT